jgi:hypothetical protein
MATAESRSEVGLDILEDFQKFVIIDRVNLKSRISDPAVSQTATHSVSSPAVTQSVFLRFISEKLFK